MSTCPNCGQEGAHFLGPSLGEPGGWICGDVFTPVEDDGQIVVVDEVTQGERKTFIVRRASTAMLAAQVMTLTAMADCSIPHIPRVRRANKYRTTSERGDGRYLAKIPGKSRNQRCPTCHNKIKRCTCHPIGGAK